MTLPTDEKYLRGETIRMLRIIKGLKQSTLATKANICQQAISKLERSSKVREKKFLTIAAALKCSKEDIAKAKNFTILN